MEQKQGDSATTEVKETEPPRTNFQLLAVAIKQRLEELKVKSMGDLSDATPYFSGSRLIKVFLYHVIYFLMIGPMAYFPVAIFSGHTYAQNIAFGFIKPMALFFII